MQWINLSDFNVPVPVDFGVLIGERKIVWLVYELPQAQSLQTNGLTSHPKLSILNPQPSTPSD